MTGSSPSDVWVCSPGDADKIFYHYDGQVWKSDQVQRTFSPLSINSLNSNEVWSCGFLGKIWTFNGTHWIEFYSYSPKVDTSIILQEIRGFSTSSIYAVGQYFLGAQNYWGIILHYDKRVWKEINIAKTRTLFVKISKDLNGKYYLLGLTQQNYNENGYQLYEFNGTELKIIHSGSQNKDEFGNILELGEKIYFIIGFDFYSYDGKSFIKVGRLSDNPKFLNVGIGRNEKDIFLGMRDGIAHYNGENTVYLFQTKDNVFVRKGVVFNKDVFFLGRDINGNNLIFHGKLNE